MTIFDVLNLRSEWEHLTKDFKLDSHDSNIDNLLSYINDGAKGNRFRANFQASIDIATNIVKFYGSMEPLGRKLER